MQGEAERSNERHLKDVTSRTCTEAKRIQMKVTDRYRDQAVSITFAANQRENFGEAH